MYEQHFGLNKRPFLAKATGTNVFVGPQTASTMSALKKGLASQDAVIAVSGPAGSGKTTVVAKALNATVQQPQDGAYWPDSPSGYGCAGIPARRAWRC